MRPEMCHLLAAVDVRESCSGESCAFWDEQCLVSELRAETRTNALLVPSHTLRRYLAPFLEKSATVERHDG